MTAVYRPLQRAAGFGLAVLVSACASFHSLPLAPDHAAPSADLRVDPAQMPTRPLVTHRFDPRDGLDATETAMLAVANNPDLRILRDELGIAQAQAFAAGLLPDPTVSASQDFVTGGSGGAGATSPFAFGIAWDIGKLLTLSSRHRAANWSRRQIDLQLLWAEWQTVAQARLLFAKQRAGRTTVARLQQEVDALAPLQQNIQAALSTRLLNYDIAAAGLNAEADARRQLGDAQSQLNQTEHDLLKLLGLAADTPLDWVGAPPADAPTAAQIDTALNDLPARRPDLLALQAGYASQNEKLRVAILDQYPAINVGFNRARDNAAVYTSGVSIGLTLPLFDRNRGNIAIERATRQRLHDDYTARVLSTRSDVDRLRRELSLMQQALPLASDHAARLDQALLEAEQAWQRRQLDWPTYLAIRSSTLAADQQRLAVEQNAIDAGIALQTLLGGDWSDSASTRIGNDTPPDTHATTGPTP